MRLTETLNLACKIMQACQEDLEVLRRRLHRTPSAVKVPHHGSCLSFESTKACMMD